MRIESKLDGHTRNDGSDFPDNSRKVGVSESNVRLKQQENV